MGKRAELRGEPWEMPTVTRECGIKGIFKDCQRKWSKRQERRREETGV